MLTIEIFHTRQWIEQHDRWDTTSEVVDEWPLVIVHVSFIGQVEERLIKVLWYKELGGRGNSMESLPKLLQEAWEIAKEWKQRTKIEQARIIETGYNHHNNFCVNHTLARWVDNNTVANVDPEAILPDRKFIFGR